MTYTINLLPKGTDGSQSVIPLEQLRETRVYVFFAYILWPLSIPATAFVSLLNMFRHSNPQGEMSARSRLSYMWTILTLPIKLLSATYATKEYRLFVGILLTMPMLVMVLISGPFFLFSSPHPSTPNATPFPPAFYSFFNQPGKGLLGINSDGSSIAQLLTTNSSHSYFISVVSVLIVVILGTILGKFTYERKRKSIIMFLMEVIESIPSLFFLVTLLAVFGWWESGFGNQSRITNLMMSGLRVTLTSFGIALGFLPKIVRLVNERIESFFNENFIDGAKAHGVRLSRILWFHIIKKNTLSEIILLTTQILALVFFLEISLDYLITISAVSVGAQTYASWAQMLMSSETRAAIMFLEKWWLWIPPGLAIISTVIGIYLLGDGLSAHHQTKKKMEIASHKLYNDFYSLFINHGIIS